MIRSDRVERPLPHRSAALTLSAAQIARRQGSLDTVRPALDRLYAGVDARPPLRAAAEAEVPRFVATEAICDLSRALGWTP